MLLIVHIVFFCVGMLTLLTGRFGLGESGVAGGRARLIGLLLVVPLAVNLLPLLGGVDTDSPDDGAGEMYGILEVAALVVVMGVVAALVLTAPPSATPTYHGDETRL